MQIISIENFKGYKDLLEFSLDGGSLLLFGENGAGKSSLYEALKYFFFHERIENSLAPASTPSEERTQILNDYRNGLRFAGSGKPFSIMINGQSPSSFPRSDYNVFFISPRDLMSQDEILLSSQLNDLFFDSNINMVLDTLCSSIQEEVNEGLKNSFREDISISIDRSDKYRVSVKDDRNNRIHGKMLQTHFNESRLRLIQLLLLLEIVHLSYNESQKNILVLDDFVISLDAANRAFIIQYILTHFHEFQLVILTHSVGFYDLFRYDINQRQLVSWKYACVYSTSGICRYYEDNDTLTVDLSTASDLDPQSLKDAGNKLRRKFEILVHKLARFLCIGSIEESKTLLEKLHSHPTFYRGGQYGADQILDWVYSTASTEHYRDSNLAKTIIAKLSSYRIDLSEFQGVLEQIMLFQKVALHPSSHAISGTSFVGPVCKKELEESECIIKELESKVNRIVSHNESLF